MGSLVVRALAEGTGGGERQGVGSLVVRALAEGTGGGERQGVGSLVVRALAEGTGGGERQWVGSLVVRALAEGTGGGERQGVGSVFFLVGMEVDLGGVSLTSMMSPIVPAGRHKVTVRTAASCTQCNMYPSSLGTRLPPQRGEGVWYSCIQKVIMGYSLHEDS